MTASLFDLTSEALAIQNKINDAADQLFSDDPDEAISASEALETLIDAEAGNRRALEAKADAWCWVIDHLRAKAATRMEHSRRLAELAKEDEHRAEILTDRLISALTKIDPEFTGWLLPEHKITSRRVSSIVIDPMVDPADLPEPFMRTKVTHSFDKTAIKEAILAGQKVPGAQLVERRSWKIC